MSRGEYVVRSGSLDTHWKLIGTPPNSTGCSLTGFSAALAQLSAQADTEALSRLARGKMELGVSLLEARKSINHLAITGIRLLTVVRNLRKGRFSAVADELGLNLSRRKRYTLAKDWLEYQYAWRPLIMDVSAAYDIVQEGLQVPLTQKVTRNVKTGVTFQCQTWRDSTSGGKLTTYSSSESCPVDVGVKTIIYTRIVLSEVQKLQQLGLINPAEIAWELVPFSFVVDWFVPVGTFLSACTATYGQEFVSGTRTKWLSCDHEWECAEGSISNGLLSGTRTRPTAKLEVFEYNRQVLADFPVPQIYGRRSLSTNKVVTAAALFRSLRR
jgi:hypothetical protein